MKGQITKKNKFEKTIEVSTKQWCESNDSDRETNDFDLREGKIPTPSTIKAQLKTAKELLDKNGFIVQRTLLPPLKTL